jgi:hypothetical protein
MESTVESLEAMPLYSFSNQEDQLQVHTQDRFYSNLLELFWGLMIFNIDRFIVTSTGKGDGTSLLVTKKQVIRIHRGTDYSNTQNPLKLECLRQKLTLSYGNN